MHTATENDVRARSIEIVARLREAVRIAGVDPGDTFDLDPELVSVTRVVRLAGECGVSYLELFSIA